MVVRKRPYERSSIIFAHSGLDLPQLLNDLRVHKRARLAQHASTPSTPLICVKDQLHRRHELLWSAAQPQYDCIN